MRRRSRRAALAVAAASALLLGGSALSAWTQPTSAAWTDPASLTAAATTGTWATGLPPVQPGSGVSVAVLWGRNDNTVGEIQVCATVTVSSASASSMAWDFFLNTGVPPWNGATSGYQVSDGNDSWSYVNGQVRVSGTGVSAGHPHTVTVCNYDLTPIPAAGSSGYYTVTTAHGAWTSNTACVVTTIRGNGTQQFYFDWSTAIDLSSAFQRIGTVGRVAQTDAWGVQIAPALSPQSSSYAVTGQEPGWNGAAIAGTGTYTVTLCAFRY